MDKGKLLDFTIGADPEFACLDEHNNMISAGDYTNGADDFGADGNGITFEIRPGPSPDPIQVVNNIREIFIRQTLKDPRFLKFKWVAGSWHQAPTRGYPLGGHVHFGIPDKIIKHKTAVNFLDHYVGIVSLLLEKRGDALNRRASRGYGVMGDMRVQQWGFEYRPLSSWLGSPYVASAILCLSKTVMYEVVNNSKFNWHKFALPEDFTTVDHTRILSKFPEIWDDITKMELYQVHKPYLDLIYYLVKNKLTWLPPKGMKESWGIVDMSQCISNKIGLDVIWSRYNNEMVVA